MAGRTDSQPRSAATKDPNPAQALLPTGWDATFGISSLAVDPLVRDRGEWRAVLGRWAEAGTAVSGTSSRGGAGTTNEWPANGNVAAHNGS
ncbi:hypothetical protein GCM10020219_075530 [Nonomuraea dietziae]